MPAGEQLTLVLMFLALSAYRRVVLDSSKDVLAGLMWATITVRLFPPRASCRGHKLGVMGTGPSCPVVPTMPTLPGPSAPVPEVPIPHPGKSS